MQTSNKRRYKETDEAMAAPQPLSGNLSQNLICATDGCWPKRPPKNMTGWL